jgi:hypothetical protein
MLLHGHSLLQLGLWQPAVCAKRERIKAIKKCKATNDNTIHTINVVIVNIPTTNIYVWVSVFLMVKLPHITVITIARILMSLVGQELDFFFTSD